jgi:hypothetical protein
VTVPAYQRVFNEVGAFICTAYREIRGEESATMSGFTKLVPEIIQSSIWNEPSDIRIVWITLIAVKDENGYVRGDARTVARMANVSEDVAEKALESFQKPDARSHTPDNEGRRIAAAPGGWIVLNHELYRTGDRTAYMRDYMREYRAKNGVNPVNINVSLPSASVSASVSESLRDGKSKKFVVPEPEEVTEYAKSIGFNLQGQKFCDFYEARGWMVGKSRMKDWRAAVRTWKTRQAEEGVPTRSDKKASDDQKRANRDRMIADYQKQIVSMTRDEADRFMLKVHDTMKDVVAENQIMDYWLRANGG